MRNVNGRSTRTINLPVPLHRSVSEEARKRDTTMTDVIHRAIHHWVETQKEGNATVSPEAQRFEAFWREAPRPLKEAVGNIIEAHELWENRRHRILTNL